MNVGYSLIMATAILGGFAISRLTQQRLALNPGQRLGIGLGAFAGAMVGAKLPFLFDSWEAFLSGAAWFGNGKTILTGLVGGYLGVEIAKWALGTNSKTGDSFVVPVAVAIAIGRIGCFQAGCCYGQPTSLPWGVVFSSVDGQLRHPTQLYESLFHITAAAVFLWLGSRNLFAENRFKLYVIVYAAYRFLTEWLRPEARIYAGFTGYQVVSLGIIGLFVWLWVRDASHSRTREIQATTQRLTENQTAT
jgi:prolipoprotein diacylglyceryltransferase